jgi:hypothetical protein
MLQEMKLSFVKKSIFNLKSILFLIKNFICDEMNSKMNHKELDEMNGLDDEINNGKEWTIKNVLEMEKNFGIKFPLLHNLNENSLLKFKFKKCENLFVTGSYHTLWKYSLYL